MPVISGKLGIGRTVFSRCVTVSLYFCRCIRRFEFRRMVQRIRHSLTHIDIGYTAQLMSAHRSPDQAPFPYGFRINNARSKCSDGNTFAGIYRRFIHLIFEQRLDAIALQQITNRTWEPQNEFKLSTIWSI